MSQYEAMFLFDPTFGSTWENCEAEVRRIMDRASAQIVFCRKWDERRLAYKIRGRKRGLYVLTYFTAPQDKISGIERDCQISENILRVLVLRADDVTPEMMEKAVTLKGAEATPSGAAPRDEMEIPSMLDDELGRRTGRGDVRRGPRRAAPAELMGE